MMCLNSSYTFACSIQSDGQLAHNEQFKMEPTEIGNWNQHELAKTSNVSRENGLVDTYALVFDDSANGEHPCQLHDIY